MSREQDSRRKAKEGARSDKARGHQTRRARGGKTEKKIETQRWHTSTR